MQLKFKKDTGFWYLVDGYACICGWGLRKYLDLGRAKTLWITLRRIPSKKSNEIKFKFNGDTLTVVNLSGSVSKPTIFNSLKNILEDYYTENTWIYASFETDK